MKKILLLMLFGVLALLFCGVAWADEGEESASLGGRLTRPLEVERLKLEVAEYPVTDGSTSAQPLGAFVACTLTRTPFLIYREPHVGLPFGRPTGSAKKLRPVKDEAKARELLETAQPWEVRELLHPLSERISHRGTHGAYERLIRGQADLVYECRLPSEDERRLMAEQGVELEIEPIALDAFVFVVNVNSPVEDLSRQQIRGIFSGEISNWRDVGGRDAPIRAYTRNRNSGSQELMRTLAMKDLPISGTGGMVTHTMTGPVNRLASDTDGIGYSVHYYVRFMTRLSEVELKRCRQVLKQRYVSAEEDDGEARDRVQAKLEELAKRQIRMISVNGVLPTPETIAPGAYPLVAPVYAVVRTDLPGDHNARKVRNWLLTDEGERAVQATGYVPAGGTQIPQSKPQSAKAG